MDYTWHFSVHLDVWKWGGSLLVSFVVPHSGVGLMVGALVVFVRMERGVRYGVLYLLVLGKWVLDENWGGW